MSTCIRHGCDRKARPGMVVCETCLDRLLWGRAATDTAANPSGRPGASTTPVRPSAPLSELELRWAHGDR